MTGMRTHGWGFSPKDVTWASRLGFVSPGSNLGLEARIWALMLGFGPRNWDLRGGDVGGEGEEEGENLPYV